MSEQQIPTFDVTGERVALRRSKAQDCDEFIGLMQASESFHHPWLAPPKTPDEFKGMVFGQWCDHERWALLADEIAPA